MIQYVLEVLAFQLVFLVIYDFWLKRETFFQWNRAYLIGAYLISIVLPWVKIDALKTTVPQEYLEYPEFLWNTNSMAALTVTEAESTTAAISSEYLLFFGGMVLASLFFINKLRQLYLLKRKGEIHHFPDFTQIIIGNSQVAFSFFKSIFIGDGISKGDYKNVIAHELVHIKQRHTYDLLFFELMRIVCWFNPLVYVYQNRVAELHEFIADAHVAKTNKKEHYQLLLSQVFETRHISFINQFFKSSLIKKRIVMLQKKQSRKIWQLKYLLLMPLVLGMLSYTSAEMEINSITEITSVQNDGDARLIMEMRAEIENEIQGLLKNKEELFKDGNFKNYDGRAKAIFHISYNFISKSKTEAILSKDEYFKSEIVTKMFFDNVMRRVGKGEGKVIESVKTIPLPSTERYKDYVSRKEAFFILDPNLQFSIKAYEQKVGAIPNSPSYRNSSFVFDVENVKDLTGVELRAFNNKMAEIFEEGGTGYDEIILTDQNYAFRIYTGMSQPNLEVLATSDFKGLVERVGNTITLKVRDLKALTKGEKGQEKKLSEEVRKSIEIDTLIITDGKGTRQLVRNSEGIFLKLGQMQTDPVPFAVVDKAPIFPGCEEAENSKDCFRKSLQLHISKNFKYPKKAEEQGMQGRVSVMFTIDEEGTISSIRKRGPFKLLENEAVRIIDLLPQMKPGKHNGKFVKVPFSIPITFKLSSSKFVPLKNKYPNASNDELRNIKKYNELVKERNRLLQNTTEDNLVIINLDDQLEAIRGKIAEAKMAHGGYNSENLLPRSETEMSTDEAIPFAIVELVPGFPGCEEADEKRACFREAIHAHINEHFRYPKEAQTNDIQGRVSLIFVIGKDGIVRDIRKKGPGTLLENEAERIISLLPKMTPGKQGADPVDVEYSIPITFKL